jgi:microtubule-associated protein-like 6
MFDEEEAEEGDQALAVKPFLGEVNNSVPSGYVKPKNSNAVPDQNLELLYCHGFRSFDTRGNLKYTSSGEIAFTTAALGIV